MARDGHVVADGERTPLGLTLSPANRHDAVGLGAGRASPAGAQVQGSALTRDRLGRRRWKVERTQAWFGGFRRLVTRHERRDDVHLGVNLLTMCLIAHRRWRRLRRFL